MSKTITDLTPDVANKRIGLIGVGKMGVGIGRNLLRKGTVLQVIGRNHCNGVEDLISAGAIKHDTVFALGKVSDIVVLSLPSSKEVEQVCLGENGLFASLSSGSLVIDCTTSLPSSTATLVKNAADTGISFVDAPVTRTPKEAEQGRLIAILGADDKDAPRAISVLAAFCETVVYAGPVGSGHIFKLLNNALTMSITASVAETCRLALDLGVEIGTLREIIGRGGANCGPFQGMCSFLLNEDPNALAFSIRNAAKDLRYLSEISKDVITPSPVIKAVSEKYERAVASGIGDENLPHLVEAEGATLPKKLNNGNTGPSHTLP